MSFSLQAIKTVDFTNAPVTFFSFQQTSFSLSLFFLFQEDLISHTKKALYQKRSLSEVYGPLFIKEFWVPPRIRIFIKTEFSA